MRPPLNAGENLDQLGNRRLLVVASMRPPLNAGENEHVRRTALNTMALQ